MPDTRLDATAQRPVKITALAGGVGGARFLRGLRDHLDSASLGPAAEHLRDSRITVIGNTGDDITLFGLRVCPDLDTLVYTLGGSIHEEQGWGRSGESFAVQGELSAYGVPPEWFGLGDKDMGTHIARSLWLGEGASLSEVTTRIATRWGLPQRGIDLLPMTDEPVETHVVINDADGHRAVHFQEWWVRMRAAVPAQRFVVVGMDRARPAPGVLEAIATADLVILPPSNPVVSIGIILGVPGVREALRGTRAPVVGVSPLISGAPVRGHADACLSAIGVDTTASAVAGLYEDFLHGWLVDDADLAATRVPGSVHLVGAPLLMRDRAGAAALAGRALDLGLTLRDAAA